ncbi:type 1 fimbria pilin [Acinetobacter calcoaceticus]|uniref:Type 1 fimbria pilin n=1 Tax=Acinetobacter calcoaceticus TaxID=471 RepID=A0A4R1XWU7_ACICA|nr:type 1 fimbria pilin [Acinetobacter calcoaceticus]
MHKTLWRACIGFKRIPIKPVYSLLALLLMLQSSVVMSADNIRFYGVLSAQPCDVEQSSENILVDMKSILNNDLYNRDRTVGQVFHIGLLNCDTDLAKTIRATFQGQESTELPGYMQINLASQNSGTAIGLEMADGRPIRFNQSTPIHLISDGAQQIKLRAFVRAEPSAIASRSISLGTFNMISTFYLEYE